MHEVGFVFSLLSSLALPDGVIIQIDGLGCEMGAALEGRNGIRVRISPRLPDRGLDWSFDLQCSPTHTT